MPYRISLTTPAEASDEEVRRLNEELSAFYRGRDACLESFVIAAADGSGELGCLGPRQSDDAAEHTATHQHSVSLRSQPHPAAKRRHADRSLFAP